MVTERSAESATSTLTLALLFALFGSPVLELTEAVSGMIVPGTVFVFTLTTKVIVAVLLAAMAAGAVQVYGATIVHVQPDPLNETNVVFGGSVSLRTGAFAGPGPGLVTTCV